MSARRRLERGEDRLEAATRDAMPPSGGIDVSFDPATLPEGASGKPVLFLERIDTPVFDRSAA